jgi:hypothetical protein
MQHPGRNLRGWLENKPPERHPRMRQREHCRFVDFVSIEENIDINRTRGPTLRRPAAESRFKLAKFIEQKQWCGAGLDYRGRVKKLSLIRRPADRLRSVPLAVLHDLHIGQGCDMGKSGAQCRFSITKIGPEAKETAGHKTSP